MQPASPSSQRDYVGAYADVLNYQNYYIPPIIFAKKVDENGEESFNCIDGKQRCTSLLGFMDGSIPFVSKNKQRYWYTKYANHKQGIQLPETLKRRFENIQLQIVEYPDLTEEQQRDIFREPSQRHASPPKS